MDGAIELGPKNFGNPRAELEAFFKTKKNLKIDEAIRLLENLQKEFDRLNRIQTEHKEEIEDLQGYIDTTDFAFYLADPAVPTGHQEFWRPSSTGMMFAQEIPQIMEWLRKEEAAFKQCGAAAKGKGKEPNVNNCNFL
jgi:hypothetical protein